MTAGTTSAVTVLTSVGERPTGQQLRWLGDAFEMTFEAPAGLYQFSGLIDGAGFDWELVYCNLEKYGNNGQRTGPWDFELGSSQALMPSFWVEVDGERLGLWFFQRIRLDDLVARQFRGRTAFLLAEGGSHCLRLVPLNMPGAGWLSASLEPDPVDCLEALPPTVTTPIGDLPLAAWLESAFWVELKSRLMATQPVCLKRLEAALRFVMEREDAGDDRARSSLDIPLLVAAWRYHGDQLARERALNCVRALTELPHWGNPNPTGYGHNGDMAAALAMRALTWGWYLLRDEMGADETEQVLAKLRLQGERLFRLALINRDYWGGSVLQDHGYRSHWLFGTAALYLHGVIPEAETWLHYLLPRVRQALAAMPIDGVIPPSSYSSTYLFFEELSVFRETLWALSGIDSYDEAPVEQFAAATWHLIGNDQQQGLPRDHQEFVLLNGGVAFFQQLVETYHSGYAASLRDLIMAKEVEPHHMSTRLPMYHHARFWGALAYREVAGIEVPPASPSRRLMHFEDAAFVCLRDDASGVAVGIKVGPWCGYNAERRASGPCDRMAMRLAQGSFDLIVGGERLITDADSRYRLHSGTGSVMLVEGEGQIGSIGYPMSVPSFRDPGAEIRQVIWDEVTGTGRVLLDLTPAYPAAAGLVSYTREFRFPAEKQLDIVDRVSTRQPKAFSWLFQALRARRWRLDGMQARQTADPRGLTLSIQPAQAAVAASIHDTDQVFSYSSQGEHWQHVRYDTQKPTTQVCVGFRLQWN